MATQLTVRENGSNGTAIPAAVLEKTLIVGDLAQLTPGERVAYYLKTCESLRLNPLTKPFEYLELDHRLVLYANRNCADQLRGRDKVDLRIVARELVEDVYVVTARATLPDGRNDESIGAVPLSKEGGQWKDGNNGKRYFQGDGTFVPLRGDARANAIMKAETKAKRRVTLSIVGLGFIDESEIETIDGARRVQVDHDTGEITEHAHTAPRAIAPPREHKPITPNDWKHLAAKGEPLGVVVPAWDAKWSPKEALARFNNLDARIDYAEAQGFARATGVEAADLPEKITATAIRQLIEELKDRSTVPLPGETGVVAEEAEEAL